MVEVAFAFACAPGLVSVWHCRPQLCPGGAAHFEAENFKGKLIKKQQRRLCHATTFFNSDQPKEKRNPLNFNFRYTYEAPLYESPQASFDQYLENKHRVLNVIFPDNLNTQLNEEEWRIQMPAMQALFLTIYVILFMNLRSKSMGKNYPPHVPQHLSKIIELDVTRWELLGASAYEPRDISLSIKGAIYSERRGIKSLLKYIYGINLSYVVPPLLDWVPHSILRSITESLVKTAMEDAAANSALLADYGKFKTQKLI